MKLTGRLVRSIAKNLFKRQHPRSMSILSKMSDQWWEEDVKYWKHSIKLTNNYVRDGSLSECVIWAIKHYSPDNVEIILPQLYFRNRNDIIHFKIHWG